MERVRGACNNKAKQWRNEIIQLTKTEIKANKKTLETIAKENTRNQYESIFEILFLNTRYFSNNKVVCKIPPSAESQSKRLALDMLLSSLTFKAHENRFRQWFQYFALLF